MIITSRENRIYKLVSKLSDKRGRDESSMFVIEGIRSVRDAAKKGVEFYCIVIQDGYELCEDYGCSVYTFAPRLFGELSGTVTPQGIIAVCKIPKIRMEDIKQSENSCVIMCEKLQDPGNIGTVIRTAHAAFCDGVILTKGCCDLYNPKIIRATMSGVFSIPAVSGADSKAVIDYYKRNGYKVIAGALCDNSVGLYETDLTGKCLIVVGNEGNGIDKKTLEMCDVTVKIPMREDAESLNAAVAGAVIIYEKLRQNIGR